VPIPIEPGEDVATRGRRGSTLGRRLAAIRALHVTVRYMSQERYVSRRVTRHGAGYTDVRCTTWTTLRETGGGGPGQKYLVIAIW
jgi:hypothetical protein